MIFVVNTLLLNNVLIEPFKLDAGRALSAAGANGLAVIGMNAEF